jgi:hypothetical protein
VGQGIEHRFVHLEAVVGRGKMALPNLFGILLEGRSDRSAERSVLFCVLRDKIFKQSQQVVPHLHLTVAGVAGANADRRDAQRFTHDASESGGEQLQDDTERTRLLQGLGVAHQVLGRFGAAPLHAVAGQLMHGLRRQANMAHNGNAAGGQPLHGWGDVLSAFELDGLDAGFLHQPGGILQGLLRADRVGHKG